jgi:tetratricopeptide (TPR) repeat protein
LVFSGATTVEGAAAVDVKGTPTPNTIDPTKSVEQLAAKAATAFRAGEFEAAILDYRRAIALASRSEDVATLRMNVGACLVELKRFEEAKVEFLKIAETSPPLATKARLSAALVAVELGQLDEAESLLEAAAPIDDALSPRAEDIKERIRMRRTPEGRDSLDANLTAAATAIDQGNWSAAEVALRAARNQFEQAKPHERVDILHSLATVELALNRPEEAKATLVEANALAPHDPEIHYTLGRAHQALSESAEARSEYKKAIELGLKDPQAQSAKHRLEALDPLGPSEWFGWLSLAEGYDNNPRQSGTATETTLGRRGRGGSTYGRIGAELGRTQRLSDQFSLRFKYAGEWLGLQKKSVQDLSLQNHGVYGGVQWAPTDKLTLGLEVGPSVTYVGLSSITPFSWDLLGSFKLRYRASEIRSLRVGFDARKVTGQSGWEFLGGTRLDAEISHQWSYTIGSFRLGLRGRHLAIGSRTTTVDATYLPACTGICDGATYYIPLSYSGFGPIASGRLDLASTVHLVGSSQLDWRRYRDESYIAGVAESVKRRNDLRFSAGLDLQLGLDQDEHFLIVPSYAILVSSSNMALSTTDPSHSFDYDDRSFVQHFVELGVELSF